MLFFSLCQAELAVHKKKIEEVESWLRVNLDKSKKVWQVWHVCWVMYVYWIIWELFHTLCCICGYGSTGWRHSVAHWPLRMWEDSNCSSPCQGFGFSDPRVVKSLHHLSVQNGGFVHTKLWSRSGVVVLLVLTDVHVVTPCIIFSQW